MSGNHGKNGNNSARWTEADIKRVAGLLRAGLSASNIAAKLGGKLTRNAVCGRVHRDPKLRAIGFDQHRTPTRMAQKQSRYAGVLAAPKPKKPHFEALNIAIKMESRALAPKPAPVPSIVVEKINTLVCRAIPLMELQRGDCRWVCNEAGPGELHLFCALPADGSYCSHHRLIAFGRGTESERSAHRELRMVAAA